MKYISLIIENITGIILCALAVNYFIKCLNTFGFIFAFLSLDRIDITNLYWKMKDDK